ncbi:hypothetical protein [Marinobacter sp.]|uniref:hypothetical protein n=1 Tax=Marinobacter sp. TaxID=50741 RepID=UPI001B6F1163|nr:hypothetical protein [Marinobacter sp.]MBQ0833506.1 hypothetical protein [Marinobacter sp.]
MRQRTKLSKLFTISAIASGLLLAGCGDDGKDGKDGKDGSAGNAGQSAVVSTTSGFAITENAIFVAPDAADEWRSSRVVAIRRITRQARAKPVRTNMS